MPANAAPHRLRKGAPWLKTTLVQCAWAASRKKGSYLQAQFQRLRHRRGPKKAICAVAASILTAVYHMLRDGTFYQDLGADHFHRASPEAQANRLARQIAKLGFTCSLTPASSNRFLFSRTDTKISGVCATARPAPSSPGLLMEAGPHAP